MAVHVIDEANRCLQCKKPMCQQGCPIHTSIPVMIKELKEGRLEEAAAMLFENNPMSLVCSWCATMKISAKVTAFWGGRDSRFTSAALRTIFPTPALSGLKWSASPEMERRWR